MKDRIIKASTLAAALFLVTSATLPRAEDIKLPDLSVGSSQEKTLVASADVAQPAPAVLAEAPAQVTIAEAPMAPPATLPQGAPLPLGDPIPGKKSAVNATRGAAKSEPVAAEAPQPKMEFRPTDQQATQKPLSEANEILASKMEVIDFREADLQDVLRLIAAKSRLNIIMNPNGVTGKVTLHLENVRLGVALDSILRINNLAYVVEPNENIVRIVSAKDVGMAKVETKTEVIQINWVNAGDLATTLEPFITKDGQIAANKDTNAIIVTDTPPTLDVIRSLVAKVDVAERQVLVEARLTDLSVGALRQLGVSVDAFRRDSSHNSPVSKDVSVPEYTKTEDVKTTTKSTDEADKVVHTITDTIVPEAIASAPVDILSSNLPVDTSGKGLTWAFGKVCTIFGQDFNISAEIQALEDRNLVEILANPKVMTLNNIKSSIKIIQRIPYVTTTVGSGGATTQSYEFADAGVVLDVTPTITPNGFVRMALVTSQMIDRGRAAGGLTPPIIDQRDANTNVIVRSAETIMIGGLRQLRMSDRMSGVPWFCQIPVIGWLFKSKENSDDKTQLVLFVTPSIIEEPTLTTEDKAGYDRIDTKWHLPDYFFDDVKTSEEERMKE